MMGKMAWGAVCIGLLGMMGKVAWLAESAEKFSYNRFEGFSYNRASVRANRGHVAVCIRLLAMMAKVVCIECTVIFHGRKK